MNTTTTIATHPAEITQWVVTTTWLGATRVVFKGSLFSCLEYVSANNL